MKVIVVYGSRYGTSQKYAEEFGKMTHYEVVSYDSISDLSQYRMVIFFGGIYARTIRGLKETVAMLNQDTQLIILTVGLSNPITSRVEREKPIGSIHRSKWCNKSYHYDSSKRCH